MPEMDIIVSSSIHESLGNTLIEAGYAQKPVVGSNVDGCGEVVINGETGILLKCTEPVHFYPAPGVSPMPKYVVDGGTRQLREPLGPSPKALADAIIYLLQNPEKRFRMGSAARERIKTMFSIERYVNELESIYLGKKP
jgi:glycosyltransferase involved in cell wall biosynthesis